jgi:hypothetical protein
MTISNRRAFEEFRSTQQRGLFNWALFTFWAIYLSLMTLAGWSIADAVMK